LRLLPLPRGFRFFGKFFFFLVKDFTHEFSFTVSLAFGARFFTVTLNPLVVLSSFFFPAFSKDFLSIFFFFSRVYGFSVPFFVTRDFFWARRGSSFLRFWFPFLLNLCFFVFFYLPCLSLVSHFESERRRQFPEEDFPDFVCFIQALFFFFVFPHPFFFSTPTLI